MTIPNTAWFWVCLGTIVLFGMAWVRRVREGWALPAMAVLATVSIWYLGDVCYNDYSSYPLRITPEAVGQSWVQLWLFTLAFGAMVGPLARKLNRSRLANGSQILRYYSSRIYENPEFQKRLDVILLGLWVTWLLLTLVALARVQGDVRGLLAPYLGTRVDPWARERLGGGFSSLLSLAGFLQLFCASAAGVLVSLARRPRTRFLAALLAFLALPFFIFHPRRNVILIAFVPPVLTWVFVRWKAPLWLRILGLLPFMAALHIWLGFVIENRAKTSIAAAFVEKGIDIEELEEAGEASRHKGLNMFEELSWINYLLETKALGLNWGARYFAELTNPIPRALWPGKPTIGLDYAVARGFGDPRASAGSGSVAATVSTGMVGQGVTCFGGLVGPVASALIMSLWVALLTRLDLTARDPGSLILYLMGFILTFNLGRDINLINIYPLLFGMVLLEGIRRWKKRARGSTTAGRQRPGPSRRSSLVPRLPRRAQPGYRPR